MKKWAPKMKSEDGWAGEPKTSTGDRLGRKRHLGGRGGVTGWVKKSFAKEEIQWESRKKSSWKDVVDACKVIEAKENKGVCNRNKRGLRKHKYGSGGGTGGGEGGVKHENGGMGYMRGKMSKRAMKPQWFGAPKKASWKEKKSSSIEPRMGWEFVQRVRFIGIRLGRGRMERGFLTW